MKTTEKKIEKLQKKVQKLDLRGSNKDIFYKIIYPATAK